MESEIKVRKAVLNWSCKRQVKERIERLISSRLTQLPSKRRMRVRRRLCRARMHRSWSPLYVRFHKTIGVPLRW